MCHRVSLLLKARDDPEVGGAVCTDCRKSKAKTMKRAFSLPTWTDKKGCIHYELPEELCSLSEGEKLLIQQVEAYVPLIHLQYGQLGLRGHVCCFPKDISGVCLVLPKLPEQVTRVKVVKHYKVGVQEEGGEEAIVSKTFVIRRKKVLSALYWLKRHNPEYANITIKPENLNWMGEQVAKELPVTKQTVEVDVEIEREHESNKDIGPSKTQIADVEDGERCYNDAFGILPSRFDALPKAKDNDVVNTVNIAKAKGALSIDFPYVAADPVSESEGIFLKVFPWLFPGGKGDFSDLVDKKVTLQEWAKNLLYYEDGRFAKDKIWPFYALNFLTRKQNLKTGGFFVDGFFKNGPQSLEELQERVDKGDTSWVDSISYFSKQVHGSSAFWRARRHEVFSWVNHHLERGNGAPSFFITLSCAEYHWEDIKRLVKERMRYEGLCESNYDEDKHVKHVNDYSLVVQEYFQLRVQHWLDTVGKEVFGIKSYWYRFEFAPSRGQIHVHMLAHATTTEVMEMFYRLRNDKKEQAKFLQEWVRKSFNMSAWLDTRIVDTVETSNLPHPATKTFSGIRDNVLVDAVNCQLKLQQHVCSKFCLKKHR